MFFGPLGLTGSQPTASPRRVLNYFARRRVRPASSKRRVLDALGVDRTDEGTLRKRLSELPERNINERMALMHRHEAQFCTWRLQLR